tara:strand:+ start:1406 stop:1612 length:207 start_codon:yes stop_codon:yes gene_type:complete
MRQATTRNEETDELERIEISLEDRSYKPLDILWLVGNVLKEFREIKCKYVEHKDSRKLVMIFNEKTDM